MPARDARVDPRVVGIWWPIWNKNQIQIQEFDFIIAHYVQINW